MNTYTVADFEQARFAEHLTRGLATRDSGNTLKAWQDREGDTWSDPQMLSLGWVPVAENRVTEHTLRDSQEKAEKKRQKLLDHIASLEAVIRRRNDQIERQVGQIAKLTDERDAYGRTIDELRDELREKAAPLSLDDLHAAWENAERADECREGGVLIWKDGVDGYQVHSSPPGRPLLTARILSRAPQREPWQDLADVLLEDRMVFEEDVEGIVKRLHERGVRVTGGDEK